MKPSIQQIFFLFFMMIQTLHGQKSFNDSDTVNQRIPNLQVDSLSHLIHGLNDKNDSILKESKYQSNQLESFIKKSENREFNLVREIISPIFISILAAIIFWATFSFLPERRRRLKIRPKLDLDIYYVYSHLFSIFDAVMRGNSYSPSHFQQTIRGTKLKFEDLELGLQNKCLNETYLYDNNVNKFMIVTGEILSDDSSKIDLNVDRLFNFSSYLTTYEILLLEKIRKKLQTYDLKNYRRSAISILGGIELKPINSSLAYMANNLFELYELFIELQKLVFQNKYYDRNISLTKVQYLYYSDQYKQCKKWLKYAIKKYPKEKEFLEFYLFLCEYSSGGQENAYQLIESLLKNKPHLVSSRGFLKDTLNDGKVKSLLTQYYTESDISELNNIIRQEDQSQKLFMDQAKNIKKYFKEKSDNNRTTNNPKK
jgi:hypothetical protein